MEELPERLVETVLCLDLSGRVPYGVKVEVDKESLCNYDSDWDNWAFEENPQEVDTLSPSGIAFSSMDPWDGFIPIRFVKPYLFPLSSLKEEDLERIRLRSIIDIDRIREGKFDFDGCGNLEDIFSIIDDFNKNHIDYRRLIDLGLANDATGLNIYEDL